MKTIRWQFSILVLLVGVKAFASNTACGPTPPGGKLDSKCQIKTAPPPISYLEDTRKLIELVRSEQLYFLGSDPNSLKWSGEVLWYGDTSCFKVDEKSEMSGHTAVKSVPCSTTIKNRANLAQTKIGNVEEFKSKLTSCLKVKDVSCLRALTSKNIQVSFGVEPPGDQAYLLYSKWKDADFKKMLELLAKGITCNDDKCEFPKQVSNGGTGLRGGIEKVDGRWLLTYYLAGD